MRSATWPCLNLPYTGRGGLRRRRVWYPMEERSRLRLPETSVRSMMSSLAGARVRRSGYRYVRL